MRIGLVSFEYPPFRGGGIGTYASLSARFLADFGHEVHVVSNTWGAPAGTSIEKTPRGIDVTVHRIAALDNDFRPLQHPLEELATQWDPALFWSVVVASKVEEIHAEHALDVIEFPECFAEAATVLRRRRHTDSFADLPVVVMLHTPFHEHMRFNQYRLFRPKVQRRIAAEDFCIRHADQLASPSAALVEIIDRRLGTTFATDPTRCSIIPYPLDFPPRSTHEGDQSPVAEDWSLLFVGRLEPRKGVRLLIDAVIPLFQQYQQLRLTLVGRDCPAGDEPGMMSTSLMKRIPSRFKNRVELTGEIPRAELFDRYSKARITVLPAHWDNFPFTCCEAMTRGACVVAGNAGGAAELIEHRQSGMLFQAGSSEELRSTLDEVLADQSLRLRMRNNASERVRQVCDPERICKLRSDLFDRAIAVRRATNR